MFKRKLTVYFSSAALQTAEMLFSLISNTQSCQLQWCWWSQGERLHAILITRKLREFGGDQQVLARAVISGGGRLLYSGSVIIRAVWKDTGQHIIVERGEVFERVHHWTYEVIVPLDLRQHLKEERENITCMNLTTQDCSSDSLLHTVGFIFPGVHVCYSSTFCAISISNFWDQTEIRNTIIFKRRQTRTRIVCKRKKRLSEIRSL